MVCRNVSAAWVVLLALVAAVAVAAGALRPASAVESPEPASPAGVPDPYETETLPNGEEVVAGQLIVNYQKSAELAAVAEDVNSVDGVVDSAVPATGAVVVEIPNTKNGINDDIEQLAEAKRELEAKPDTQSVEYDYIISTELEPNDPYYATYRRQAELKTMKLPGAWDRSKGTTARLAVVDSGCAKVEDLDSKIVAQYDFVYEDSVANDPNGHGTHVAGSVAAETNDGTGMAAAGYGAKIICARALDAEGRGSHSDIMQAIRWSRTQGAAAINLSLGGGPRSQAFEELIRDTYESGTAVFCAAGNGRNDEGYRAGQPHYPSNYYGCFGVGAVTYRDQLASFSEVGGHVDGVAPGVEILSTLNNGGYGYKSGTSMATPQLTGIAGLLHSRGYKTAEQKYERIRATADDLGAPGRDDSFGIGRVDAAEAVLKRAPRTRQRRRRIRDSVLLRPRAARRR